MRSLRFLLLALCLAPAPGRALAELQTAHRELGRPNLRIFGPRDYQADPLCQAIAQDADGVMVVANNTGALAFDGLRWQAIRLPAASTGITQLVRGPGDFVYAGGGSVLGFFRGPVGRKEYVSLLDRLPAGASAEPREYRIAATSDALYCSDDTRLWVWRGECFAPVAGAAPPKNARLLEAGGGVWVHAPGAPLFRIVADRLEPFLDDPLLRDNELVRLAPERDGWRALTRERGFLSVTGAGAVRRSIPADAALLGKRVRTALPLADGSWLIAFLPGSGNAGLRVSADGAVLNGIDESIGLPNRALRAFAVDREGGAWIGLEAGLARVEWPGALTLFDATNGLHGFVTTIARHEGAFYAGTIEGLFRLVPGDPASGRAARFERLLDGPVYGLLPDADGLLIRAQQELLCLHEGRIKSLLPLPGAIGEIIRSRRDPRRYWLNTMQGLHALYRTPEGWRDEGRLAGFSDHVASFLERTDGTLWIASFNRGLVRLRFTAPDQPFGAPPQLEPFARGAGLPDRFDHCAVYEWRGAPLFYFDGVPLPYRFDDARREFTPWPEAGAADLPLFNCWSSAPSGDDLWFTNNDPRPAHHAIFRRRGGRGAPQHLPHAVADAAGKIWRMVEESGSDGVLWICASNGLLRLDLAHAFPSAPPLVTLLRPEGIADGARVPAANAAPSFAFAAPRFQPGAAVQFQTRLAGLEDSWLPWSAERTRTYAHLPPGSFRFEVRARDADGVVSDPAGISFVLLPPWWRTAWAVVPAALAAIALVAAVTRWLALRALRHRLALLEAQSAVERERLRLARDLHDDIGSGLGRVILFAGEAERAQNDPVRLNAALGRIRASAQELVQHAREIVWAVSPQHDTAASLAERLADHVADTFRAAHIACSIDLPVDLPTAPLHSEARHSLFLAVKEAVHNTVKYAEASDTVFRITAADDTLVITLADNGRGFAPGERRGSGHGLRNLAARAEALGGSVAITSAPGQGTTVVFRIPLALEAAPPAPLSSS